MPQLGAISPAFADLLGFRVQEVVFVLSHYDSFILAEDGQLNDRVLSQFLDLNLTLPPTVTQVASGAEALALLREQRGRYQLVIGSPHLGDMEIADFAARLREQGRDTPVALFGYDPGTVRDYLERHRTEDLEKPFVWQGDVGLFLAIVKQAEDRRNAPHDTGKRGVPAILLIEDSIRYYSSFLPVVYQAVFEQTRKLIPEGLSLTEKYYRIRTRPKIFLCDHYEEARRYFEAYSDEILGVISDIEYPRNGRPDPHAGERFVAEMRKERRDIPAILHSHRPENEVLAERAGADFLLKGSPDLLRRIRRLMRDRFHFGDFVFRMPDGEEVARATDLDSFQQKVATAPRECVVHHAEKNDISHWLMARGELELARRLRAVRISDYGSSEDIGPDVARRLRRRRRERSRAVVADFPPDRFEPTSSFLRVGSGSVGGKGRGLAFTNSLLDRSRIADRYPGALIEVPAAVVIATGVFDRFMEENDLYPFALDTRDEMRLRRRFDAGRLPADAAADLARFAEAVRYPLAVRSSSLLEDSPYQPFSGVYETLLLPNRARSPAGRLKALERAVKQVYASLFLPSVHAFLDSSPYRLEEEKMAVILQRVVGADHGRRFYPDLAGAARSRNHYSTPPLLPEDGVAAVAVGLGEQVTAGGAAVRFSPKHPTRLIGFATVDDIRENSQRDFLALDLDARPSRALAMRTPFLRGSLADAEADGVLAGVGSTWSAEENVIRDGTGHPGARLVTLAPLLKAPDGFPLAAILDDLLRLGEEACRGPVELEFAVNLSPPPGERPEFGFVQLRRLQQATTDLLVEEEEIEDPTAVLCRSDRVLGQGRIEGIRDLLVVDRERFDRAKSLETAREIARQNASLVQAGRPYALIGVGRWGSRDRHLGIPVTWDQVSGAQVIVETGFRDLVVTPSQGTHFFENLVSNGIGYFTVNPERGEGELDWEWLSARPAAVERGAVRRIELETPVRVCMRGGSREGWILKPD